VKARALVVSLGVDTFEGDPISGFKLKSDDYLRMGEDLARAGCRRCSCSRAATRWPRSGINAVNVLEGFAQAR
jgi:acetoin utilization deacetylase AcuC-like enzyme